MFTLRKICRQASGEAAPCAAWASGLCRARATGPSRSAQHSAGPWLWWWWAWPSALPPEWVWWWSEVVLMFWQCARCPKASMPTRLMTKPAIEVGSR